MVDIHAEYKEALFRAYAEDMVAADEEERVRRGLPPLSIEEAEEKVRYYLGRIPQRLTRMRYPSFTRYFGHLMRLGYVERTGREEPSLVQESYPPAPPRRYFRLTEAKERFEALEDMGVNPKEFTYVDSEEPEFRGMLRNPLPNFWSEELSKAWAGVNNLEPDLFSLGAETLIVGYHNLRGWRADDPEMRTLYPITHEMEKRAKVVEEHPFENSGYTIMEDAETRIRWVKRVY